MPVRSNASAATVSGTIRFDPVEGSVALAACGVGGSVAKATAVAPATTAAEAADEYTIRPSVVVTVQV